MPTTLITGANRGLGLELARQYAADGWRVHACCRRPEAATELGELASGAPGSVLVHELDVLDRARIDALADELRGEPIDVLLLSAGLHGERGKGPAEIDHDVWDHVFRVNAMAPLAIAGAFVDHVAASALRRIVLLSSIMGSIGANADGGNYVYRSSKAAANAVARSLAFDLRPRDILVLALHPGWVRTEMGGQQAPLSPEESVAGMREVIVNLTPARSGRFLDYRGTPLPW
jgi:NAD(P)-dependent dehydrogenase (short-subunit alcohol dehydrogenase family)